MLARALNAPPGDHLSGSVILRVATVCHQRLDEVGLPYWHDPARFFVDHIRVNIGSAQGITRRHIRRRFRTLQTHQPLRSHSQRTVPSRCHL